jgi:serine protease AprX
MAVITINGNTLDPDAPAVRRLGLNKTQADTTDYIVVQTKGLPVKGPEKAELAKIDVKILLYVGNNTYLCSYKPKDFGPIHDLPFVGYVNAYLQNFVVESSLKQGLDSSSIGLSDCPRTHVSQTIDVLFHDDVEVTPELLKTVAEAAHVGVEALTPGEKVRIDVQSQYLDDVAAIDAVKFIQKVSPLKLHNNVARKILEADFDINGTEFKGEGQTVCVCDTGFDTGKDSKTSQAARSDKDKHHAAFGQRVEKLFPWGRNIDASDLDGHGKHTQNEVNRVPIDQSLRLELPLMSSSLISSFRDGPHC